MNEETLSDLIALGEGYTIEFKRSGTSGLGREICAFANATGGVIGILHRMEAVERIGSGIRRIRDLCREHGVAEPLIEVSESWVTTTFPRPTAQVEIRSGPSRVQATAQVERNAQEDSNTFLNNMLQRISDSLEDLTTQVTAQVAAQVVWHCRVPRTAKGIMDSLGLKHWKTFRTNYLQPLLDAGWLEMTIPDKPTSSKQKYRLTIKGQQLLAELGERR